MPDFIHSIWLVLQHLLLVAGSLGLLIYGMKVMSDGIQKTAGKGLRNILHDITSNKYRGIFTGFLTTGLIQSSSATTVMVISFVNAGLIKLRGAFGLIMGANVGTTLTAWMINYLGIRIDITPLAIIMIGLSLPLFFSSQNRYRNLAEAVIGFGILFIGLQFLKISVPDLQENPEFLSFLDRFSNLGFISTILFVFVGAFLTIVVQSSSAASAVTLIMLSEGWISFPLGAAMLLGENIGTTLTANLAAIVANVHAKRAARFHFLFNAVGLIWALLTLPWMIRLVELFPFESANDKLPVFHSAFNVINVLILMWFLPIMEKMVVRMVPSRGSDDEAFHLKYIGGGILDTPELSIAESRKEVQNLTTVIQRMCAGLLSLFFSKNRNKKDVMEKIRGRESISDQLEVEITSFLSVLSEKDISADSSNEIQRIILVINELESIADIFYKLTITYEKMEMQKITLLEEFSNEMEELFKMIYDRLRILNKHMLQDKTVIELEEVYAAEDEINSMRNRIQNRIFQKVHHREIGVLHSIYYLNIINNAEDVGDHIVNINEALVERKLPA